MDRMLAARIGAAAKEARQQAQLTQADVAEALDMAPEVYGRLERGRMLPSVERLHALCRYLRMSPDDALGIHRPAVPLESQARAEALALEEPGPSLDVPPELRLLVRRARKLDRQKLRLLTMLAESLAR